MTAYRVNYHPFSINVEFSRTALVCTSYHFVDCLLVQQTTVAMVAMASHNKLLRFELIEPRASSTVKWPHC